jgi:hypothetical protein
VTVVLPVYPRVPPDGTTDILKEWVLSVTLEMVTILATRLEIDMRLRIAARI